jgi:hypothetical protein
MRMIWASHSSNKNANSLTESTKQKGIAHMTCNVQARPQSFDTGSTTMIVSGYLLINKSSRFPKKITESNSYGLFVTNSIRLRGWENKWLPRRRSGLARHSDLDHFYPCKVYINKLCQGVQIVEFNCHCCSWEQKDN